MLGINVQSYYCDILNSWGQVDCLEGLLFGTEEVERRSSKRKKNVEGRREGRKGRGGGV